MNFDEYDIKILKENFNDEMISQIDADNLAKILKYLSSNGVYYSKDLLLSSLDLFLIPSDKFIIKFEKLKNKLGTNFVDKLGEDASLIEIMYED